MKNNTANEAFTVYKVKTDDNGLKTTLYVGQGLEGNNKDKKS